MRLPDLSAYQAAVQNPSTAFADPELRAATVASGRFGLPRAVAGNFAVTYHLRDGTRQWAVRCFHRDASDRARRYTAISQALAGLRTRMLVNIAYLQPGVRVGQAWLPVTKMPWLEGQPLNRAVEARLSDPKHLGELERRFVELVSELRTLGIAHGDLQHGNILVDRLGQLSLVDYDGMFVPALRGLAASESGDPNYQHPRRTTQFDADLDRFAAIVIVVALRALAAAPGLWRTYNTDDNLLFCRTDFADTARSPLFRDLRAQPATRDLAERLEQICRMGYTHVPLLDDVLDGAGPRAVPMVLVKPAHVAVLNRLFGGQRPPPRRRAVSGPRSWKLRRSVAQQAVAFSADGTLLVTADAQARLWVRETTTGRTRYSLHLPRLAGRIGAVAFDASGNVMAAVLHGSSISIWDVTNGSWKRELLLTRGEIRCLALSAGARFLVAATDDGTLRCWRLANGALEGIGRQSVAPKSISVTADGRWMASVGAHAAVQMWELPGGRSGASLAGGAGAARLALSADGRWLGVVGSGGRVTVWDVAKRTVQHEALLAAGRVLCLAIAPDGQRIASVSDDGSIAVRLLGQPATRQRQSARARPASHDPTRLRPPEWLRDVLRRVATAVP